MLLVARRRELLPRYCAAQTGICDTVRSAA